MHRRVNPEASVPTAVAVVSKRKTGDAALQVSTFLITCNTNRTAASLEKTPGARETWERNISDIFSDPYPLLKMAPRHADQGIGEFGHVPKRLIRGIEVDIGFEEGDKLARVHAHVRVRVEHWTFLQINLGVLHDVFRDFPDEVTRGTYVNCKLVRDGTSAKVENYLTKRPVGK